MCGDVVIQFEVLRRCSSGVIVVVSGVEGVMCGVVVWWCCDDTRLLQ